MGVITVDRINSNGQKAAALMLTGCWERAEPQTDRWDWFKLVTWPAEDHRTLRSSGWVDEMASSTDQRQTAHFHTLF